MKRVLLLLLVASLAQAQVQTIQWSKVSGRDTVFMAGSLWGISTKFVTFKDGSYMSSAAGFSDTTKYVEWADSAATAGWVTREKFRLDTTYKAAQLLLRVLYTDSGTTYSSFAQFRDSLANARSRYVWKRDSGIVYASFPQFRDTTASARSRYVWKPDSGVVYMSWPQGRDSLASARSRYVWKRDSGIVYASYPQFRDSLAAHWSQLLLRVLYSDTGTTAAKIPKNWYLYDQINDSLAEYMLRANPVSTGTLTAGSFVFSGAIADGNVGSIQNPNATGISAVKFLSNTGSEHFAVGYGNASLATAPFTSKAFVESSNIQAGATAPSDLMFIQTYHDLTNPAQRMKRLVFSGDGTATWYAGLTEADPYAGTTNVAVTTITKYGDWTFSPTASGTGQPISLKSGSSIGLNTSDGSDNSYIVFTGGGADGAGTRGGKIVLSGN